MKTWNTQTQSWRDGAQMIVLAAIALAVSLLSAGQAKAALNPKVDLREAVNSSQQYALLIQPKAEFQEQWFQALVKVLTEGEKSELPEVTNYYVAKGTSFDRTVERTVKYIALATRKDAAGELIPLGVSTVTESWKKEGDNWRVEQKIFVSSVQGKLSNVISSSLVLSPDGALLSRSMAPQPPLESETQQKAWQSEREEWVQTILGQS